MKRPTCPYCGKASKRVHGDVVYPQRSDLAYHIFYRCEPCNAHVGTHIGTSRPLGTLANNELRALRARTHRAFDPIWRRFDNKLSRTQAYKNLAEKLGIPVKQCHIGMFDKATCKKVLAIMKEIKK